MNLNKLVLNKWGYRNEKHNIETLNIYYRENTTDSKVVDEVLVKHCYQKRTIPFLIESNDIWLDLGANIGTFSLYALSLGCKVVSVEPDIDNLTILKRNLENNFKDADYNIIPKCVSSYTGTTKLYLCNGTYNKYRHSMHFKKRETVVTVDTISIDSLLERFQNINAIKIDIEGEEISLLENINLSKLSNINKLVFEYSFDIDSSIERFLKIIDKLSNQFKTINYTKVKSSDKYYKFYPPSTIVYCCK